VLNTLAPTLVANNSAGSAIKFTQIPVGHPGNEPGGATSCGLPSQTGCGDNTANYVFHAPGGASISVPGSLCLICFDTGGDDENVKGKSEQCSFTSDTLVATEDGEKPIGSLKPDEKVWAYNTKTQKMELQPIQHVWVNHDDDLVDLTILTPAHEEHGKQVEQTSEVVHTNKKHPFLTTEKGFVPVGELSVGMHVRRADGSVGMITRWAVVPGSQTMYNLEVAQDHTFMVGDGQWVVHNQCDPLEQSLAGGRRVSGMPPRSVNPDDGQTFAILYADGKEYWGVNGDKYIPFNVNAISKSHAEIDALAQLYQDRTITGDSGGTAVMIVDRLPCRACSLNGIRSGVRATGLRSLVVYAEGRLLEVLP
jgi:hypothetical protein